MNKLCLLAVVVCFVSLPALAQDVPEDPDLRLYVMGNSLTDELSYDNFLKMAEAGGKTIALGSLRVPGAPIGWLWSHNLEKGGFTHRPYGNPNKAFAQYKWNAFTFQPFQWSYEKNIQHMPLFMDMLYKNSPDCQVYIYAQWPYNGGGDWIRGWLAPRTEQIMSREEYEDHVTWLRENYKKGKPARLIPVGHAMYVMEQKIRAGQVPGLTSMWQAYDDGVHVNNLGNLFVASTYYATLFGEDPTPLPYDMFNGPEQKITLTPELAGIVRESVWQVVATHPMTGVTTDRKVQIVTPAVDPGVAGSGYVWELLHAFGKAPCTWALSAGALPDGLRLLPDGTITGTPAKAGEYSFTARLTDGAGSEVSKQYTLRVNPDTAPRIAAEKIPDLTQGRYVRIPLKVDSVNPPFHWEVADGTLPKGMKLSRAGMLMGAPGPVGDFKVIIQVTDGDSQEAETDRKAYTLSVKPGEDVEFARKLDRKPKIDGKLDGDPWKFTRKVKRVLDGKARTAAWIDYAWTKDAFYVAVKVEDDTVIGKRWSMDGADQVRLYFDGLNNREETYNWDDIILRANPAGGRSGQGRTFRTSIRAGLIDGGYLVEAVVPFGNLGHRVSKRRQLTADWVCVGLDAVVLDVEEKDGPVTSRMSWHGPGPHETDPSGFRTIIMKP
jgi:hypothetical protein